ncbi:MAG TPA: hypothetical protein VMR16_00910, partial [Candidatus Saccharimonadales bacterium]|nr:hypothetical protein [Candidatus Saccharimonadales bacterium]
GYNSDMFLVGILSWWYGKGLSSRVRIVKDRLRASVDFFSVDLLISTLFAPFRQISAGDVTGSIDVQVRAFFDRLLSRFIGAFVRTFMIVFGLIAMLLQIVFGIIVLIFWLIIPLLPIIGLIMWVIGWVPK